MTNLSSRILSLVLPIVTSVVVVLIFLFFRRPLLTEVLFSLIAISVTYFIFVFICLLWNIGIKKEKPFDFSEIPGLTKNHNWFRSAASTDTTASLELATAGDDPVGCLVGALIAILLPFILAVVLFIVSGGVEVLLFLSTYLFYYSIIRVLRMQLAVRKKTKGNWLSSLFYSAFFTLSTVGLLPFGLLLYMFYMGKPLF